MTMYRVLLYKDESGWAADEGRWDDSKESVLTYWFWGYMNSLDSSYT